jgi:hypothetical protein
LPRARGDGSRTAVTVAALLATVIHTTREREQAAAALAPVHAPRFNAVALLGPGETALSAAFRWMLDERADHGQGGMFRDLFFRHLLPAGSAVDWSGAAAHCEVATRDGGRIDVLRSPAADAVRAAVAAVDKPAVAAALPGVAEALFAG